jgi:hypothetical protein
MMIEYTEQLAFHVEIYQSNKLDFERVIRYGGGRDVSIAV